MVFDIIICLLLVVVLAALCNFIESVKRAQNYRVSMKESMDLIGLPVITMTNNKMKLNLLVDTGCDFSRIDKSIVESLECKSLDDKRNVITMSGEEMEGLGSCSIQLKYKKAIFEDDFEILDLEQAFSFVKKSTGVQLHGIIGSNFLSKYGYVLNFKDLEILIDK